MADELRIPCEVYSRVVGYLRPVHQSWNEAKQHEFSARHLFDAALDELPIDNKEQPAYNVDV